MNKKMMGQTAIAILSMAFLAIQGCTGGRLFGGDDALKEDVLHRVNALRAESSLAPLHWEETLAKVAKQSAPSRKKPTHALTLKTMARFSLPQLMARAIKQPVNALNA